MSLHQSLRDEVATAMKARDSVRLQALRATLSELTNELVRQGKKPQDELSDDDAIKAIKRLVKQRKDSIEQFISGGREDLVENEQQELEVLQGYLPESMGLDEIRKVVEKKKEELGITDPSKKGMLIGAVMKELGDRADGSDVKTVVEELLG